MDRGPRRVCGRVYGPEPDPGTGQKAWGLFVLSPGVGVDVHGCVYGVEDGCGVRLVFKKPWLLWWGRVGVGGN